MKPPVIVAAATLALTGGPALAQASPSTSATTTYHTAEIDGLHVFYREAGPRDAPTLLLLHGFPSSSRMFETLIPLLADRYHVVAPDYPGFGRSDAPPPARYNYTFDHIAGTVDQLVEQLGMTRYVLYLQDYGGPVGMGLALAHPERVQAIIVQNAVASEAGLGPAWDLRRAFWKDRAANEDQVISSFQSLETTKGRHIGSSPNVDRYDPNVWLDEFAHLSRRVSGRSSPTCSSTTKPTSRRIRNGRPGCASTSRRSWWSGGSGIRLSHSPVLRSISRKRRMHRCTSLTPGISRSTRRWTRSPP